MAIAKRTIKNVRDIRTHSGTVGQTLKPHEVHMRLSVLEMEKARRGKERESAILRVRSIDERFREIEKERSDLLMTLTGQTRGLPHSGREIVKEQGTDACPGMGGFQFKY